MSGRRSCGTLVSGCVGLTIVCFLGSLSVSELTATNVEQKWRVQSTGALIEPRLPRRALHAPKWGLRRIYAESAVGRYGDGSESLKVSDIELGQNQQASRTFAQTDITGRHKNDEFVTGHTRDLSSQGNPNRRRLQREDAIRNTLRVLRGRYNNDRTQPFDTEKTDTVLSDNNKVSDVEEQSLSDKWVNAYKNLNGFDNKLIQNDKKSNEFTNDDNFRDQIDLAQPNPLLDHENGNIASDKLDAIDELIKILPNRRFNSSTRATIGLLEEKLGILLNDAQQQQRKERVENVNSERASSSKKRLVILKSRAIRRNKQHPRSLHFVPPIQRPLILDDITDDTVDKNSPRSNHATDFTYSRVRTEAGNKGAFKRVNFSTSALSPRRENAHKIRKQGQLWNNGNNRFEYLNKEGSWNDEKSGNYSFLKDSNRNESTGAQITAAKNYEPLPLRSLAIPQQIRKNGERSNNTFNRTSSDKSKQLLQAIYELRDSVSLESRHHFDFATLDRLLNSSEQISEASNLHPTVNIHSRANALSNKRSGVLRRRHGRFDSNAFSYSAEPSFDSLSPHGNELANKLVEFMRTHYPPEVIKAFIRRTHPEIDHTPIMDELSQTLSDKATVVEADGTIKSLSLSSIINLAMQQLEQSLLDDQQVQGPYLPPPRSHPPSSIPTASVVKHSRPDQALLYDDSPTHKRPPSATPSYLTPHVTRSRHNDQSSYSFLESDNVRRRPLIRRRPSNPSIGPAASASLPSASQGWLTQAESGVPLGLPLVSPEVAAAQEADGGYVEADQWSDDHSYEEDGSFTNNSALWNNVPGVPGEDYPVLTAVPVTDFSCDGKVHGLYADYQAQCQVWHNCHENGHDSFLCVAGTLFSPLSRTCDWWYNVDCTYVTYPPY